MLVYEWTSILNTVTYFREEIASGLGQVNFLSLAGMYSPPPPKKQLHICLKNIMKTRRHSFIFPVLEIITEILDM